MKTKHKQLIGLLVITVTTIASTILNINPAPVLADPGVLKWDRTDTPGSVADKNDIVSPCEVNRIAIGSDGKTFYAMDIGMDSSRISVAPATAFRTQGGAVVFDSTSIASGVITTAFK